MPHKVRSFVVLFILGASYWENFNKLIKQKKQTPKHNSDINQDL